MGVSLSLSLSQVARGRAEGVGGGLRSPLGYWQPKDVGESLWTGEDGASVSNRIDHRP